MDCGNLFHGLLLLFGRRRRRRLRSHRLLV
jgi:hypothetical protein